MSKVLFISDFYSSDLNGGAENNDSILIDHLSQKFDLTLARSHETTVEIVRQSDFVIVSNFVNLSEKVKGYIQDNKKYIIYEHDHKYTTDRDPSRYLEFIVPEDRRINISFYENAVKVFVLSEICKDILSKNIPKATVHSIGCSLWSEESFRIIEKLSENKKINDLCILDSKNPIKGVDKAVYYCKQNGLSPVYVGDNDYYQFLEKLAGFKKFLFLPQVLETYSRVCAEAKMLNVQVMTTPKKLGFASESNYSLSGTDLIKDLRDRNRKALSDFTSTINQSLLDQERSVTAILTCYRRPQYLKEQIEAIRAQTVTPEEIWLWVNHHEENEDIDFSVFDVDRVIKNDFNWKFHGRFALAQLAQTKYVALFDDDTIPAPRWLENCLENYALSPGIYGGIGVLLKEDRYYGHQRVGWSAPNEHLTEVDLVGHAWFLNKKDLQFMWREEPFTWHNGEDIQLSYLASKYGNIKTYVPPHPLNNPDMFSSTKGLKYGVDDKATSRPSNHKVFYNQRDEQVKHAILNGWKPVFMRN